MKTFEITFRDAIYAGPVYGDIHRHRFVVSVPADVSDAAAAAVSIVEDQLVDSFGFTRPQAADLILSLAIVKPIGYTASIFDILRIDVTAERMEAAK